MIPCVGFDLKRASVNYHVELLRFIKAISYKNYGKNFYRGNFVFLPPSLGLGHGGESFKHPF